MFNFNLDQYVQFQFGSICSISIWINMFNLACCRHLFGGFVLARFFSHKPSANLVHRDVNSGVLGATLGEALKVLGKTLGAKQGAIPGRVLGVVGKVPESPGVVA